MRSLALTLLILTAAALAGCSTVSTADVSAQPVKPAIDSLAGKKIKTTVPLNNLNIEEPSFAMSEFMLDSGNSIELSDEDLQAVFEEFDVPMTMTPRVQHYVNYFTGPGRNVMQKWIDRSNLYMYIVRDIFHQEDVPQDLVVLSFTESGFNPHAKSHAGAVGMWQFMKGTGKMYKLDVNEWVDERQDFEKASRAAARHLSDLYDRFDDWYLALAAYNAGSGRISSATKKHKTTDFFTIATSRTLKLETRDYVPKYLAQLIIYKNMIEYGFTPPDELPLLYDTVEITKPVNIIVLANHLGCSVSDLKMLNPELKTPMTPPVAKYSIRVPAGDKDKTVALLGDSKTDLARYHIYKAKSGETIARIAKQFGVTSAAVKKVNSYSYDMVYTSKVLFIPKSSDLTMTDTAFSKEIGKLAPKYYVVRKGDNMTSISKKHNIPLKVLVQMNPNIKPSRIYPGQVLVISRGGLTG